MWGSENPIQIDRLPNGQYRCRLMAATGIGENPCIAIAEAYKYWRMITGSEGKLLLAYQLKKAREAERNADMSRAIILGVGLGILL